MAKRPRKSGAKGVAKRANAARAVERSKVKFWVPPSIRAAEPVVPPKRFTKTNDPKPAAKFWKPEQLGFSERQEYNVDHITWSSVEEHVELYPGVLVMATWYGRPITGVAATWQDHRALARLPKTLGRDDPGGSECLTCYWHNLGNPRECPITRAVLQLLYRRTGQAMPDDEPPF